MKVLISAPRAGSSYVYEQIEKENLKLPNVRKIGPEEFFDPNQWPEYTIDDKIDFLLKERNSGIEYTFKHHINYLKKEKDYYNNWFKDFYKDHEIIVLKRRDTWNWFLSFLFQDSVKWNHAYVLSNDAFDEKEVKKNFEEYDFKKTLNQFFKIKSQLDTIEGHVIFYEDTLVENSKYKKLSSLINYESYFKNLGEIKNEFRSYQ